MRVLVTRPAAQADEWVQALRESGLEAEALPLIGIAAADDAAPLHAAWRDLAGQRLVVFVSPNAVEQFCALRPQGAAWPPATLAGSPGPGTTRVLQRHGVPAACIVEPAADAPQFDSEALWTQLAAHDWRGAEVLVVRGESGRDWLADRLRAQGARIGFVTAYRRGPPQLDAAQRERLARVLLRPHEHAWLFSSSEAIDHLLALAPRAADPAGVALATHPRIAERARAAGFGAVHACRPSREAVVACIQSIAPPAP